MPTITARATNGAFIRCTILPIPFRMRWRASPTPCVPWNLKRTGRCTTGWWSTVTCPAKPRQIEFARLGIDHTVMSKRKLRKLVEDGHVSGWDDPRMPTLCGLRRRGYTPASIRNFCDRIGVSKVNSTVEYGFPGALPAGGSQCARHSVSWLCCAPFSLTITNYPEGQSGDRLRWKTIRTRSGCRQPRQ